MDALARELEDLYAARYIAFRNALAAVTGSRELARDAVQEAFARALAGRERHREGASLAAWVWKIAYRLALEERRKGASPLGDHAEPELPQPQRDPELASALRRLDVSEGTVAAALAQAHAELRASLEPEGAAR